MIEYNAIILDHFNQPRHTGSLENASTIEVGSRESGAIIQLYALFAEATIKQLNFKAYGCAATIACCSYLCELVSGKTTTEALSIDAEKISRALQIPEIKKHCAVRVISALRQLIEQEMS